MLYLPSLGSRGEKRIRLMMVSSSVTATAVIVSQIGADCGRKMREVVAPLIWSNPRISRKSFHQISHTEFAFAYDF